ncbi:lipase [Cyathus striatus]|nr:lipase [Cyathus striatus]
MSLSLLCLLALATITAVSGLPTLEPRQNNEAISFLTLEEVAVFRPYSYYSAAAYCKPETTKTWTCGQACGNTSQFKPVNSGGDGDQTQFWYVGYDPTLKSVIVGYQGTNGSNLFPILTDITLVQGNLDPTLFPDVDSSIKVHIGFRDAHARSAGDVLTNVKTALQQYDTNMVTVVGHSLGAALSLLGSAYLRAQLPTVSFKTVSYSMPRVGNQAFVDYINSRFTAINRIDNKRDPVPVLPSIILGYHHTKGEIHIIDNGTWVSCPGEDNTNPLCTLGYVPNPLAGNATDHPGRITGIYFK